MSADVALKRALLVFSDGKTKIVSLEKLHLEMEWPVSQPPFGPPLTVRMQLLGSEHLPYGFYEETEHKD